MWCTQCGAEYRPGFTVCSDCNLALVDERPPPPPPEPEAAAPGTGPDLAGHGLVEYDLIELSDEETTLLELLLRGADVEFTWESPRRLLVAATAADQVDEILDYVDASSTADGGAS
ncbi:MAG TPA: hypothetical protein VIK61_02090 [Acidimicrobiia bacterium]